MQNQTTEILVDIEPGDFVRSTLLKHVTGFVVRADTLVSGKLPGYVVQVSNGREDFIAAEDTELVAMSGTHFQRVLAVEQSRIAAHEYAMETTFGVDPDWNTQAPEMTPQDDNRDWSDYYEDQTVSDLAFPYADTLETEIPLGPELDSDSIEEYEAAQVAQARLLIIEREAHWDSDKVACRRAIKALALIDGHYVHSAENELKAERVTL